MEGGLGRQSGKAAQGSQRSPGRLPSPLVPFQTGLNSPQSGLREGMPVCRGKLPQPLPPHRSTANFNQFCFLPSSPFQAKTNTASTQVSFILTKSCSKEKLGPGDTFHAGPHVAWFAWHQFKGLPRTFPGYCGFS